MTVLTQEAFEEFLNNAPAIESKSCKMVISMTDKDLTVRGSRYLQVIDGKAAISDVLEIEYDNLTLLGENGAVISHWYTEQLIAESPRFSVSEFKL